ncbi:MAG: response regulator [Desulfobacteraceae bacterium]
MNTPGDKEQGPSNAPGGILIVDDDAESLNLLCDLLIRSGYRVRAAKNGQLAIKSAKTKAPVLILLDVKMPDLDGYMVCHHLKSDPSTQEIPIIFMSAYCETVDKVVGFDLGGVDFISKPFDGPEVLARIRTHLTLNQLTHRLEKLVDQRTSDLKAVNEALESKVQENIKSQKEMGKLERQLRQTQKLEAIGTLAGGIAHDFNNILSSIIGFTELAMEDAKAGSILEDNLNEVMLAGKRAKELVNQILAFARKSEETPMPVRIGLVAKEVLKLLRATIPSTIKIKQDIQGVSYVMSDPAQIHQIFMNLCTNAAQSMEERGGELRVEVMDIHQTPNLQLDASSLLPYDYVRIEVADSGCGIKDEDLEHIFEPYFTTKTPNEGTGLGLSVVHGIVTSCGGAISVSSLRGQGSVFTVYLPTTECGEGIPSNEADAHPGGSEGILIVDDEMSVAKVYGSALERHGYTVTLCTNSQAALALFRIEPHRFDLLLTDMTMPYLSGDLLAREVRRIRPDIPVILCTGYHKQMTEAEALRMGCDAFEMKPLTKAKLLKTVREVLDKYKPDK